MNNKLDRFLKKALDKMFTYAGFDSFNEQFTKENEDWYNKKTWSEDQSNEFKSWFISEGQKDLKLTKKAMEKEYSWFYLKWGWKTL
jgi:hypothetical protein